MQFIVNSDIELGYKEWPEKLHNKNSRSFKKTFDQIEYESVRICWQLSNYIGRAKRDMHFFYQNIKNTAVTSGITIKSVSAFLSDKEVFESGYVFQEGDELVIYQDYIYKEIKDVKRPDLSRNAISLILRKGEWIDDHYMWDFHETKIILAGTIKVG